ncbi:hypothetical protein HII28_18400 [Planctomonas sp. JC2975]|uniref:YciI family protein n=1 Tax=Planctomonas sp. JC2975 TaxID=2729626 RepID=UPI001475180A|nr:YciI family protein [Planctomonas sp. JC2975]NNC13836.1 hypothetical protein [Planctomonas sp. JC2975]
MAEFLLVMVGVEERWATLTEPQRQEIDDAHRAFWAKAGDAIRSSGELEGTAARTTVRTIGGRKKVVDGPFAETKEMIGGFYLIDVPEKADAVELASLLAETRADHSGVEVIPLVKH